MKDAGKLRWVHDETVKQLPEKKQDDDLRVKDADAERLRFAPCHRADIIKMSTCLALLEVMRRQRCCRPSSEYRIILVPRGHAVMRHRRPLTDAQRHVVVPCTNNLFIPLSVVWGSIKEALTNSCTAYCTVDDVKMQLARKGWGTEQAVLVIDKVVDKGYCTRVGDRISPA